MGSALEFAAVTIWPPRRHEGVVISGVSLATKILPPAGLTFFHSAATCLHVPARLTRECTKHEGRKPRASERHVVGCCEVLDARRYAFKKFFVSFRLGVSAQAGRRAPASLPAILEDVSLIL